MAAQTSTDCDTYPESESSDESESAATSMSPPRPKNRENSGAATYKTRFNSAWKTEYPFITSVPGDPCRYI